MRDYGYLNARIRGMKTRLLGRGDLEALVCAETVPELTSSLLATTYKPDLEWGRVRLPGVAGLEEGLRRNTVATMRKVEECAKSNREALAIYRVLMSRWDVHNLRTLLRGLHIDALPQEIRESLLPVGRLDESQLLELSSQKQIKSLIDLLVMWGHPYARPLVQEHPHYAKSHDLSGLELRLDQFHYRYLVELTCRRFPGTFWLARLTGRQVIARAISAGRTPSVGLVRTVIQQEIDMVNIVTLLRLTREGSEPEESEGFFIPGGTAMTKEKFRDLAGRDVASLVDGLTGTPYHKSLQKALPRYYERGAVSVLERRLEEGLVTRAVGLFRSDPLSSAIMIAFLYAKFNELTNLRLLARGKEARIPDDRIREAMLLV